MDRIPREPMPGDTQAEEALRRETAFVARTLEVEYCKVLELLPQGQALRLRAGVGWKPGEGGTRCTHPRSSCDPSAT